MKYLSYAMLSFVLYACSSPSTPVPAAPLSFPTIQLTTDTITTYQEYPASIEGTDEVEIRPQINGILDEVLVDEGAIVTAGQPLFKINESLFRAALNNAIGSLVSCSWTDFHQHG